MQVDIILIKVVALVLAVTLHEAAHAGMAWRMGDPTAKMLGRLTLNPVKHIDPVGSILVPGFLILTHSPFLIGWAKPVPVDYRNLKSAKDAINVSAAGVAVNLGCALIAGFLFQALWGAASGMDAGGTGANLLQPILLFLVYFTVISGVLAVFNLLPIPPLDGWHILVLSLPPDKAYALEQKQHYGMFILLILLATGILGKILSLFLNPILRVALGDAAHLILGY